MTSLIDGTYNARDVAGFPLVSGGVVASGVLFRSDALARVTDAGEATIAQSGIGLVVDFRADSERVEAPDRLPADVETVAFPMLDGAVRETAQSGHGIPTLQDVYGHLLASHGEEFAAVARFVARPADPARGGVLVHCTAGKDRTGVAVALLLDAVGASRDAIADDYTATEQNLAGEWADGMRQVVAARGIPLTAPLEELLARSPRPAIDSVFERLDAVGGAAAYLRAHGLSASDLDALRTRLTAPSPSR